MILFIIPAVAFVLWVLVGRIVDRAEAVTERPGILADDPAAGVASWCWLRGRPVVVCRGEYGELWMEEL